MLLTIVKQRQGCGMSLWVLLFWIKCVAYSCISSVEGSGTRKLSSTPKLILTQLSSS
jgi:hypothetical protein